MPRSQKTRGDQISFRPTAHIEQTVLPALVEAWGEERTRAISRALQIAYDLGEQVSPLPETTEPKGRPLALRLSRVESEMVLPELARRWGVEDRGQVINLALRFTWERWMV